MIVENSTSACVYRNLANRLRRWLSVDSLALWYFTIPPRRPPLPTTPREASAIRCAAPKCGDWHVNVISRTICPINTQLAGLTPTRELQHLIRKTTPLGLSHCTSFSLLLPVMSRDAIDNAADPGAFAAHPLYHLDAHILYDRLKELTPPPDNDSQDRLDREANSLLIQHGGVACELPECHPYWNSLESEHIGVHRAQWKLWEEFRRHQVSQRDQQTTQTLERAIRARRRQRTLPHVSVRLLPEALGQCRLQTWVEFQDMLFQKHDENAATMEGQAASKSVRGPYQRGRLVVMNRCFTTHVLPWTEQVRLGLGAESAVGCSKTAKASRPVSGKSDACRTRSRVSKQRLLATQASRLTTVPRRRAQRGLGSVKK